jgi:hypothetical protein
MLRIALELRPEHGKQRCCDARASFVCQTLAVGEYFRDKQKIRETVS